MAQISPVYGYLLHAPKLLIFDIPVRAAPGISLLGHLTLDVFSVFSWDLLTLKWLDVILTLTWIYEVFCTILQEPDRKQSRRKLDRYKRFTNLRQIEAFSQKYYILSTFQVHEHLDNGSSLFLHSLARSYQPFEDCVANFLFRTQSKFFLTSLTDGPIFQFLFGSVCIALSVIIRFFDLIFVFVKYVIQTLLRLFKWIRRIILTVCQKNRCQILR